MRPIFASGETEASHGATVCDDRGDPDGTHPIYDSEGARLYPGRCNTAASPIIYTSEHYSTAMLEKLVHASSVMPPNQHYIRIVIPNGVTYEIFPTAKFPGWDGKREDICKAFGETWFEAARSALPGSLSTASNTMHFQANLA